LIEKYETSVVPGHFFEMPETLRIDVGGKRKTWPRDCHVWERGSMKSFRSAETAILS
jgi:hypothetical protein